MRTTIVIDDDVLVAAKAIARHQARSLGAVITDLARRSLNQPQSITSRNGIPLLPVRPDTRPVTIDVVVALRDEAQ